MTHAMTGLRDTVDAVGGAMRWSVLAASRPHGDSRRGRARARRPRRRVVGGARAPAARRARDPGRPVATGGRRAEQAVAAARELGYPVVLKVVSPEILHKSDIGGVALDLRTDADVERGVRAGDGRRCGRRRTRTSRARSSPHAARRDRADRRRGPRRALGPDARRRPRRRLGARRRRHEPPAPAGGRERRPRDAGRAPRQGAARRRARTPAADVDRVVETIVAFARLAERLGPRLASIEINPLRVDGATVEALDAVVSVLRAMDSARPTNDGRATSSPVSAGGLRVIGWPNTSTGLIVAPDRASRSARSNSSKRYVRISVSTGSCPRACRSRSAGMSSCGSESPSIVVRSDLPRASRSDREARTPACRRRARRTSRVHRGSRAPAAARRRSRSSRSTRVAPPPVWSRTDFDDVLGRRVDGDRRAQLRARSAGGSRPDRRRRSSRRRARVAAITADRPTPPAPNTASDDVLVELEHVHDGARTRLHAAAERRGDAQVGVRFDDDRVVFVGERMGREARLPEERPVHRSAVGVQRRRPVGARPARVQGREVHAVVRPAGDALGACATAAVAQHDAVAGPDPRRRRRRPSRPLRRPRDRTRRDSAAPGELRPEHSRDRSVWQIPQATSLTRISSGARLVELDLLERRSAVGMREHRSDDHRRLLDAG